MPRAGWGGGTSGGSSLFQWNEIIGIWCLNPKGIEIFQPGVARNELPWVRIERDHNPEKGCIYVVIPLNSTLSGLWNIMAITQGRPLKKRANPGLKEINPFRIEAWIVQRIETQPILIPLKTARKPKTWEGFWWHSARSSTGEQRFWKTARKPPGFKLQLQ